MMVLFRGEIFKLESDKVMKEARSSITVFSKDYASSGWCLYVLVTIPQAKKKTSEHLILPAFYQVDPSQVRNQEGSFAEAFDRQQEEVEKETDEGKKEGLKERLQGLRATLREVVDLAGMLV
ncbi:hypothetical protein Acr_10g0000470 [Actinidia rufa]|uniref:TIR domain-containing protein n=1 Tax=Actinidia rufa TaxID=165716 RepID=A0A7J0F7H2_9ERIC|nr:hypothetical protein Acr_10g0000470 [Actinidia rufa]